MPANLDTLISEAADALEHGDSKRHYNALRDLIAALRQRPGREEVERRLRLLYMAGFTECDDSALGRHVDKMLAFLGYGAGGGR